MTTVNTLDRETDAAYDVVVEVIDGGTSPLTTTTTIKITVSG